MIFHNEEIGAYFINDIFYPKNYNIFYSKNYFFTLKTI